MEGALHLWTEPAVAAAATSSSRDACGMTPRRLLPRGSGTVSPSSLSLPVAPVPPRAAAAARAARPSARASASMCSSSSRRDSWACSFACSLPDDSCSLAAARRRAVALAAPLPAAVQQENMDRENVARPLLDVTVLVALSLLVLVCAVGLEGATRMERVVGLRARLLALEAVFRAVAATQAPTALAAALDLAAVRRHPVGGGMRPPCSSR